MEKKLTAPITLILLITTALALTTTQQLTVEILEGGIDLQVFSPTQNAILDERQVLLNLTFGEGVEVKSFQFSDNGKRFRTLCRNCDSYERKKPFSDGPHELIIKTTHFVGTQAFKSINFTVDTRSPRIRKTSPTRGLTSGLFEVEFQEDNPKNLSLNYGNQQTGFRNAQLNISECEKDRTTTECEINVNLSAYDQQEITYNFNLTDILGRTRISRERKLEVDITPPIINLFNLTKEGFIVTFFFNITEPNFDSIQFIDHNDRRPRFRKLCSSLRNQICERRKSFRKIHNLTIEIIDDANNKEKIENIIIN